MKRPRRRLIYRGLSNRRFTLGVQLGLPTDNLPHTPLPSRAEKNATQRSNNERGRGACAIDCPVAWGD